MICPICGGQVDPSSPSTLQRVVGWEKRALATSRRGGSDIVLRQRLDDFAHGSCIEKAKMGLAPAQEAMAL